MVEKILKVDWMDNVELLCTLNVCAGSFSDTAIMRSVLHVLKYTQILRDQ